jgi:hypothetical protein
LSGIRFKHGEKPLLTSGIPDLYLHFTTTYFDVPYLEIDTNCGAPILKSIPDESVEK